MAPSREASEAAGTSSWSITTRITVYAVASLVMTRILFGLLMLWMVMRYFGKGWIRKYWIEPEFHFGYFGFDWVAPWAGDGMYWHFLGLGMLAALITFGLFYRVAAALFFAGFSYVFLLEQARYLNHAYLVCLVSLLMAVVPAHRAGSLDARYGFCRRSDTVPSWCLWLLRFQIGAAARRAGLGALHPHMLRHTCGFYLTNQGYDLRLIQDYLGHRDPKHTVRYTRVAGVRFEGLWET